MHIEVKTGGLRPAKATQTLLATGPSTVIDSVKAVREKCFRATDVEPSIHACVLVSENDMPRGQAVCWPFFGGLQNEI